MLDVVGVQLPQTGKGILGKEKVIFKTRGQGRECLLQLPGLRGGAAGRSAQCPVAASWGLTRQVPGASPETCDLL